MAKGGQLRYIRGEEGILASSYFLIALIIES